MWLLRHLPDELVARIKAYRVENYGIVIACARCDVPLLFWNANRSQICQHGSVYRLSDDYLCWPCSSADA